MRQEPILTRQSGMRRAAAASLALGLAALVAAFATPARAAEPLHVVATTPDLGALVREVGGDRVDVTVMVGGREDPHFAEAKPSFVKAISQADLFVQVGLELEAGYVPLLLENARNPRVQPTGPGFLDASTAIVPLDAPTGAVDRSMGDVHPGGSPHYLLDPLRVFAVAGRIADKLAALSPADAPAFASRLAALRTRLGVGLVGEALAAKYDAFQLAQLAEQGGLPAFLDQQGDRAALGGWLGAMLPHWGAKVVDDHAMWTYFARRFGLVVAGHLEPKPGIPPTTAHLGEVVAMMKAEGVKVVIASPYYDPRHAAFVASATGARVVELAHQVDGRDGTADSVAMIDYNVRAVAAALAGAR